MTVTLPLGWNAHSSAKSANEWGTRHNSMIDRERAKVIKTVNILVAQDPEKKEQIRQSRAATKALIDQLIELGYHVESLSDLRHQKKPWKTALPILLSWLPHIEDLSVKADIVRCLSVPWVGSKATAQLIEEFKKYAPILPKPSNLWSGNQLREIPEEQKALGLSFTLAWAIGNALSIVDVKGFEKQIIELCRNPKYGIARQMLVWGLGRFHCSEAEETAVELLNDEQVQIQAIGALGRMKSKRALFELERLLIDKRPAIRKEARKAITKIMR